MNYLTVIGAFLCGMVAMAVLAMWLVYRAHENFRKMCSETPKGK